MSVSRIVHADNMVVLPGLASGSIPLVYVDPPFNTGTVQAGARTRAVQDAEGGTTIGFKGKKYRTEKTVTQTYADAYDDYLGFLGPRLREAHRILTDDGSLFVHLDPRESHYVKVFLDGLFGRASFMNELVWAYDYGGRSKSRWSAKHDVILWYAKDPKSYRFDFEAIDRIPYMAPGLVTPEKAARGKTPTDVWWNTIVPTNGKERTGYPTQKPLAIVERIVKVHSRPGDTVLDFFAGSGTTGEAAARNDRHFLLVDQSAEAVAVMKARLAAWL